MTETIEQAACRQSTDEELRGAAVARERRRATYSVRRPEDADGAAAFDRWLGEHGVDLWDLAPGAVVVVDVRRNVLEYESAVEEALHGATLVDGVDGRGEPDPGWVVE